MADLDTYAAPGGAPSGYAGLALDPGPVPDRLPPMLFLAALVHGILIIGVTFNAALDGLASEAVSLEVTIVADPDQNIDRDDAAAYLAQASQRGSGNTDEDTRPGAPLESSVPVDNAGAEDGNAPDDVFVQDRSTDEVLAAFAEQRNKVYNERRLDPAPEEARAALLESGAETTLPLPQELHANFLVRDQNRQQIVISADTRESQIAGYVDRWKRKIESIGSRYLPEQAALQGLSGSPTLEVTIDAAGQLASVVIRRSSGSRLLDQAALNILQRAAPFEPFPEAVRADYPELNFLYKWRFDNQNVQSTAALR
jgi:protein TonB